MTFSNFPRPIIAIEYSHRCFNWYMYVFVEGPQLPNLLTHVNPMGPVVIVIALQRITGGKPRGVREEAVFCFP